MSDTTTSSERDPKRFTDMELMDAFESLRRQACGIPIGEASDTPARAVKREGWTELRRIYEHTNVPGEPVFAEHPDESLYVVCDLDGPWAICVADSFAPDGETHFRG